MALARYWSSFPVMSFVRLEWNRDRNSQSHGMEWGPDYTPTDVVEPKRNEWLPAGDNDDIISNGGHLLDCQVDKSTKGHLEERREMD